MNKLVRHEHYLSIETKVKTKAQKSLMTCLWPFSSLITEPGLDFRSSTTFSVSNKDI
jgi:hypothetical protein